MNIHFFTCGNKNTASSRVRAIQVAEKLNKFHIKTSICYPFKALEKDSYRIVLVKRSWYFLRQIKKISYHDIIYLQKGGVFTKDFFIILLIFKLIKRVKIIFDFDDAIFINAPENTYLFAKISNHIVVGGHYLKEYAERYNKNVSIVPTSISYKIYAKNERDYKLRNKLIIGWLGHGVAHYENLKILVPILKQLIKEKIQFKFLLIGAKNDKRVHKLFNIKNLDVDIIDELEWSDTCLLVEFIQKFDIGIMPLIDNEWNRGKCAFKAIEYMACGVPVVISAVGENNYLISNGENGFLVDSTEAWVDKIEKLTSNLELREKVGIAGQKTVKEEYSYEVNINKLIEIFKSI